MSCLCSAVLVLACHQAAIDHDVRREPIAESRPGFKQRSRLTERSFGMKRREFNSELPDLGVGGSRDSAAPGPYRHYAADSAQIEIKVCTRSAMCRHALECL